MSDLRPTGVPVNFDGVDRRFLFTLKVIDEMQSLHPGTSIFRIVEWAMTDTLDGLLYLVDIVNALSGVDRTEIMRALKTNTVSGGGSLQVVRDAIRLALIESMPEPDDNDEAKPENNDTGIIEVPKFLVIAMTKFNMPEADAWGLTLRKFRMLNEAYLTVNGLKKAEDDFISLSALP